jgi:hypothetical protein
MELMRQCRYQRNQYSTSQKHAAMPHNSQCGNAAIYSIKRQCRKLLKPAAMPRYAHTHAATVQPYTSMRQCRASRKKAATQCNTQACGNAAQLNA